jgi:hypothetical protein
MDDVRFAGVGPGPYAVPSRYAAGYSRKLRDVCGCRRDKYRDEATALAAADAAAADLGVPFTVYLCGMSSLWHKTSQAVHPDMLGAYHRKIAFHVLGRDVVDPSWLATTLLKPGSKGSLSNFVGSLHALLAEQLVTVSGDAPRLLAAADRAGLARVVQGGLDTWRADQARPTV